MQKSIYRTAVRRKHTVLLLLLVIMSGLSSFVQLIRWSSRSGGVAEAWSQQPDMMWLNTVVIVLCVTGVGVVLHPSTRANRFLQLDDEGLTYARGLLGGRRRWRWQDLCDFKLEGRPSYRFITFVTPGEVRWFTSLSPWVQGISPEGPKSMIEDIYDTPIGEISAKLNEYRERALASTSEKP